MSSPSNKNPSRKEKRHTPTLKHLREQIFDKLHPLRPCLKAEPAITAHLRAWSSLLQRLEGVSIEEAFELFKQADLRFERQAPLAESGCPGEVRLLECELNRMWSFVNAYPCCIEYPFSRQVEYVEKTADLLEAGCLINQGKSERAEHLVPALYVVHRSRALQSGLLDSPIEIDADAIAHLRRWVSVLADMSADDEFAHPAFALDEELRGKMTPPVLSASPRWRPDEPEVVGQVHLHAMHRWSGLLTDALMGQSRAIVVDTADILEVGYWLREGDRTKATEVLNRMESWPRDHLYQVVRGVL